MVCPFADWDRSLPDLGQNHIHALNRVLIPGRVLTEVEPLRMLVGQNYGQTYGKSKDAQRYHKKNNCE